MTVDFVISFSPEEDSACKPFKSIDFFLFIKAIVVNHNLMLCYKKYASLICAGCISLRRTMKVQILQLLNESKGSLSRRQTLIQSGTRNKLLSQPLSLCLRAEVYIIFIPERRLQRIWQEIVLSSLRLSRILFQKMSWLSQGV